MPSSVIGTLKIADLNFNVRRNHQENFIKHRLLGTTPRVLDVEPKIHISDNFPSDVDERGLYNGEWKLPLFMKNKVKNKNV